MGRFREWLRGRAVEREPLPDALWDACISDLPILEGRSPAELERLRYLSTAFILEKEFHFPPGCPLEDSDRLRVAALACLPLLGLSLDWYSDWHSIYVSPDEFSYRREDPDSAGVVDEYDDELSGQVFELGPVALSLEDIRAAGRGTGYNVVIHEMCHKLDGRDGEIQGCPPLHPEMSPGEWRDTFTGAWEAFQREEFSGKRRRKGSLRGMDPYGAEDPAEFFAVSCEYFFERPAFLSRRYPGVYGQLSAFFRQDPAGKGAVSR